MSDRESIRLLPFSSAAAIDQLAAGTAMLQGLEEQPIPAMRWYQISPAALLLGSSQRPHEVDLAACAHAAVVAHRRGSGGGIVLAGDELLLLDIAIPREHRLYIADVTRSYTWLGEVWTLALRRLGLDVRLASIDEARADVRALDPLMKRVCFGGLSPFEVLLDQRKIVGLAQIRRRGGALLQAGVYLRWEPQRTAALIAADLQERAALGQRLATKVAGLEELLGRQPALAELTQAVEAALVEHSGLLPRSADWRSDERAALAAAGERYAALRVAG